MEEVIDSYCGLKCQDCAYRTSHNCKGCITSNGNPFHGECEIAECAKGKNKRFCGECGSFPCEIITRYSNDKDHGDNGERIERCKAIKSNLVREARIDINPISYCGHHCDFCFLGQWCGGCRSNYNCCSYATLYSDYICPNVKCCTQENNLNGCYECADLLDCKKGYYEKDNEYIAKATALFIKKYGEDCYTKALTQAIEAGEDYPKTFDESGSVENALHILEKYL